MLAFIQIGNQRLIALSEMEVLDKKMNFLLDSFLDQIIDQEIYKTKKNELFEEKLKITEEITKIQTTGSSWLEPMKTFVGSALSCAKIARAKNTCSDLAIGAKTVGSNFFLTNRLLAVEYNQGFAELWLPPPSQSRPTQDSDESRSVAQEGFEPPTLTLEPSCSIH